MGQSHRRSIEGPAEGSIASTQADRKPKIEIIRGLREGEEAGRTGILFVALEVV